MARMFVTLSLSATGNRQILDRTIDRAGMRDVDDANAIKYGLIAGDTNQPASVIRQLPHVVAVHVMPERVDEWGEDEGGVERMRYALMNGSETSGTT